MKNQRYIKLQISVKILRYCFVTFGYFPKKLTGSIFFSENKKNILLIFSTIILIQTNLVFFAFGKYLDLEFTLRFFQQRHLVTICLTDANMKRVYFKQIIILQQNQNVILSQIVILKFSEIIKCVIK